MGAWMFVRDLGGASRSSSDCLRPEMTQLRPQQAVHPGDLLLYRRKRHPEFGGDLGTRVFLEEIQTGNGSTARRQSGKRSGQCSVEIAILGQLVR